MAIGMLALAAAAATVAPALSRLEARWLAPQNRARAEVGVDPLVWDKALAADAADWARHLAATDTFDHATQDSQGENLSIGTRGAYSPEELVSDWIEERKHYRPGLFPQVSTTGHWADVGHYTQIVWHSTRRIGCAMASNAENDVLVCRYAPPGNVVGENAIQSSRRPSAIKR